MTLTHATPLPLARRSVAVGPLALALLTLAGVWPVPPRSFAREEPTAKAVLEKLQAPAGLKKLREKLAADPAGARFRVDGFAVTEGDALQVQGVMLVPGAADSDREEAERAARNAVIAAVQEVAEAKDFKDFDFSETVRAVRGERLPHLQLQKAANEAGASRPAADQLKLTDARFDAAGRLVISGLVGNDPATRDWLVSAAKTVLAENPAMLDKDGKPTEPVWRLTPPAKGSDWPLAPAVIQRALAAHQSGPTRFRVERAYLVASPARADDTNPGGVSWKYVLGGIVLGTTPPDPKPVEVVVTRLLAEAKWPAIKDGDLEGLTAADNRIPDPAPKFQKLVASNPAWDGVRLDERSGFGPDGRLVLVGVEPGLDSQALAKLTSAVRDVLEAAAGGSDGHPLSRKLATAGISTDRLQRVKVRELHADLRRWAAENLDDVRLTRLYFDESGGLVLLCEAADPAVKAAVEKELVERAARLLPGLPATGPAEPKAPAGEGPVEPKAPAGENPQGPQDANGVEGQNGADGKTGSGDGRVTAFRASVAAVRQDEPGDAAAPPRQAGPTVRLSRFKGSLTKYLQRVVSDPRNRDWEALLIERGFFDETNRYTVRGVADSEQQKQRFAAYLEELAREPEWESYFRPVAAAPPDLVVIPMARLEDRLRRVMPAYEVFDGIRVNRGRYVYPADGQDSGPILVFEAQVVGRPDPAAPARLRALIAEDASYFGRRLPKGRPVEIRAVPPQIPLSDQLGELSLGYAALALARGEPAKARAWLDAGLLHYPHDAAVWFLSAYQHLLSDDAELARRDLHRIVELEGRLEFDGPAQRKRRYAAAKDLQGPKRDELEKLWLTVWREVKDGVAEPLKLAPAKAAPAK